MKSKAAINRIKKELLKKIDADNAVQLEKVDRYLNLLSIFYQLDDSITEKGVMVETINASQVFLKPNPAIAEKNKVNTSLIALGKDLEQTYSPPASEKGTSYKASDLV
ncbi:P27 family phage terminase small subunit [Listeria fleischmannii]|uniref:P27 family phage terminase small subunit n=1 Tax=Listeria fleischmannii TaxID=1069827 RepID=UPI000254F9D2|nr:P27 family phage terminase small subunit [Listeria fleischmannii]EIA21414.1 hypothetical protein KKC_01457 [Listeria fleischmannii subsp. coloradonensis]MBC1420090.1 P27 family phage terminase small subunit [Listeria fleischmannii]STY35262.1 Uncharacterised protein [Listeria fleischmannii subsp. coloradonensis]